MYTKSSIKMSLLDVEYHFKKLDNAITIIVQFVTNNTPHIFKKRTQTLYLRIHLDSNVVGFTNCWIFKATIEHLSQSLVFVSLMHVELVMSF